jgi:hypothetical protein
VQYDAPHTSGEHPRGAAFTLPPCASTMPLMKRRLWRTSPGLARSRGSRPCRGERAGDPTARVDRRRAPSVWLELIAIATQQYGATRWSVSTTSLTRTCGVPLMAAGNRRHQRLKPSSSTTKARRNFGCGSYASRRYGAGRCELPPRTTRSLGRVIRPARGADSAENPVAAPKG